MTCGIYLLTFVGTDKVYVGQSINIEKRLIAHTSLAKRGIHAHKLQKAFNTYGVPTLHIIKECEELHLDYEENMLIAEFNSVEDGFNSCKVAGGGHSLYGEDLGTSKYTNCQIEQAFLLLVYKQHLISKEISLITKVSKETIDSLSSVPRKWLYKKYPEEYEVLKNRSTLRFGKGKTLKERGIVYPDIVSPEGIAYTVENTSQFAITHKLNNAHLVQVLRGKEKQHKGWRLTE